MKPDSWGGAWLRCPGSRVTEPPRDGPEWGKVVEPVVT